MDVNLLKKLGASEETLEKLTEGFQKLPDPQLGQSAREWVVQSVSFEKFTSQLTALLKSFY